MNADFCIIEINEKECQIENKKYESDNSFPEIGKDNGFMRSGFCGIFFFQNGLFRFYCLFKNKKSGKNTSPVNKK